VCCVAANVKNAFTSANCAIHTESDARACGVSRGRHRSGVEGGSKLGNAYVEQARIARRLWGCGRAGSERGIAGGLDGEARSAFGEQELPVIPTVLAHPRTAADDDDTVVRKKIDSRHKLLPPRPHSRPRRPDFRSELFGCKQKKESVFCFVGFFVSVYAPACLLSPLLSAQGPRRERARSRLIHAPWAVVLSQMRSHSSLSAFGAAAKRMLTGLALRRLWMLDIDMRLLCEVIVIRPMTGYKPDSTTNEKRGGK